MALVLKATKTIVNPHTGVLISTAYGVVDHVENDKFNETQLIRVTIYVAVADRTAERLPLSHGLGRDYFVTGQDWTDFFSVAILSPVNKEMYEQSYLWLLQAADRGVLIWADWESD